MFRHPVQSCFCFSFKTENFQNAKNNRLYLIPEPKPKPTVEVKPNTSANKPSSADLEALSASSVTEDIDEDLDEFLNSSISASEDFTKEETVTDESTSLKADYVEKL